MRNDFTIVIPSKNRQRYFPRLNAFYAAFGCPIVIVDSSSDPYTQSFALNISYFHLPGMDFVNKLCMAFAQVNTPYVLLGADDDFLFPEAIQGCVEFLKRNPDYSSAQGIYVGFHAERDFETFPIYSNYWTYQLDIVDPEIRLVAYWSAYVQQYYALHRAENFQRMIAIAEKLSISRSGLNFFEAVIGSTAAIHGKHKILPLLYGAREIGTNDSAGQAHANIAYVKTHPDLKGYYECYVAELASDLARISGKSETESRIRVEMAMNRYLKERPQMFLQVHSFLKLLLRKVISVFAPAFLGAKERRIMRKLKNQSESRQRLERLAQIMARTTV
jgi:glycosyltransferase domain-containing protein